MNESEQHSWFQSSTGLAIMSHNGSAERRTLDGTLPAFQRAYRDGYRWFQVDALPIRGDLISRHAIFGRKWGFRKKDRKAITDLLPNVPTLYELITHKTMKASYWNIELKSKHGLDGLRQLLRRLDDEQYDLSTIMISSPVRPGLLRAIHGEFEEVALAAPVIHGSMFGVRFLGKKRATVGGREYDCQQCYHLFVRPKGPSWKGPVRQAWTIRTSKKLDRILTTDAHPIIDSYKLTVRPAFDETAAPLLGKERAPEEPLKVEALALGGGGWRGAFGGIGALMYFLAMDEWDGIKHVVGISGGAFATAALSRQPDGEAGTDDEPVERLRKLLYSLQDAARRTAKIVTVGIAVVVATLLAARWTTMRAWTDHRVLAVLFASLMVVFSSFLLRAFASIRWTAIVKLVYRRGRMRTNPTDTGCTFAIGATGLNDGRLYSFTSDPVADTERWLDDPSLATPLGGRTLSYAVVRATSLPGLGQLGLGKIRPNCAHQGTRHKKTCQWIPDKLVDGGLSGIFGRELVHLPPPDTDKARLVVVVDAGRRLPVNNDGTTKDRLTGVGERLSAVVLLARWLKVALDDAYRDELARVAAKSESKGYGYQLVRLAEEEGHPGVDEVGFTRRRHDDLNRLYVLKDQVHRFSLLNASPDNASRAIVVAVAGCALARTHEPNIPWLLEQIGDSLCQAQKLVNVWRDVRVPLLGRPGQARQLGPEEVRCTEPVDQRPRRLQMASDCP